MLTMPTSWHPQAISTTEVDEHVQWSLGSCSCRFLRAFTFQRLCPGRQIFSVSGGTVEIVSSTNASAVIPKFDKMFAAHGIAEVIGQGPPFNGDEYQRYIRALGIKAQFSTPYWPLGNGDAQRFMQPLGKALKAAHAQGRQWKQELKQILLQ